jgi:hypothetical protein
MKLRRFVPIAIVIAALVAMAAFSGSAFAQSGTPTAPIDMTVAHPAHIHNSTCATLGSIAWPLNDVSAPGMPMTMMGTPVAATPMASPVMEASATPMAGMVVGESVTTVKVNLADLEKAPFAVNVHESLPKITNYIACGDITGAITDNSLTIQLNELNNSGVSGTAMLHDNGDGTTTVSIQLMQAMS